MISNIFLIATVVSSGTAPTPEEFMRSFTALEEPARIMAHTCIEYLVNNSGQDKFLDGEAGYQRYTEQQAAPFLKGLDGKAWGFQFAGRQYVVSHTSTGICSLHTKTAERKTASSALKALLDVLYPTGSVPMKFPENPSISDYASLDGWSVYDGRLKKTYIFTAFIPKFDNPAFNTVYSLFVSTAGAP